VPKEGPKTVAANSDASGTPEDSGVYSPGGSEANTARLAIRHRRIAPASTKAG
jgi:hypothetical protein